MAARSARESTLPDGPTRNTSCHGVAAPGLDCGLDGRDGVLGGRILSAAPLHGLPDDAILEVDDAWSLEHPDLFELDVAEVVERALAAAEQGRDDVEIEGMVRSRRDGLDGW
jgi:hypothetical protein